MPADMWNAPQASNDLVQIMRPFAKVVVIVNGLLALLGIGVALYVYCEFPIPATITHHRLDKFGQPVGPVSALSYLFAYPIFQVWLAAMPILGGWRPPRTDAAEQAQRDQVIGMRFGLVVLVLLEIGTLFGTISHAVSAALGNT